MKNKKKTKSAVKQEDLFNIRKDTARKILSIIGNMEVLNKNGTTTKIKYSDLGWYKQLCKEYGVECTLININNEFYENIHGRKRPIYQIDKDTGEILHEYESLNEASKETNINAGNISRACTHKNWTAYGYNWKFADMEDNYPPIREAKRGKPVKQIDTRTGEIVHIYVSIREASREMRCHDSTIYKACRKNKLSRGYYWQYLEDTE